MSLILEALKKSEEQRQRGELPRLTTQHPAPRRRRSRLPLLLLLLALTLTGLGLAWQFGPWPRQPGPNQAALPQAVPAALGDTEPATQATGGDGLPQTSAQPTPPATPVRPPAAHVAIETPPQAERESMPMPPELERLRTVDTSAAVESGAVFAPSPDLRRPFEHTPQAERDGAVDARIAELIEVQAPDLQPALPEPAIAASAAPAVPRHGDLPMLHELPFALRRELPPLRLTLHAYSADPERRFVILNGERRGEGETLGSDLQIERIVPEGVVLRFRGEQALLPRLGG